MIGGALQKAIVAALKADAPVAEGRIFDQVPPTAKLPYCTIGNEQLIDDGNSCGDAWEVYADVHVWSDPVTGSKLEVKNLGRDIIARLATEIPVEGFRTVEGRLDTMRTLRDPASLYEHAVLTFRYLIDPA